VAWHRAYLYFFELALRDQVADVTLPWWDWTVDQRVPPAYDAADIAGAPNPLFSSATNHRDKRPADPITP
jgi:tyrosinase